ncbi:DUF3576 domain-containing protein [Actibacterium pelagium]|uniref:DUF3576 domain-containing protein n=1 Tax=Actibacterium pelagium TaxID=2029103 RepID=A0A917AK44_9RHOB|nr:DUF3576 domain-containing protein [Actibacterium pelagium]GGE56478.1 hypothetical protein GCM10011517_25260 [Actibacterium pelagium]
MISGRFVRVTGVLMACVLLANCGGGSSSPFSGGLFGRDRAEDTQTTTEERRPFFRNEVKEEKRETIWDLFRNDTDPNVTLEVNKYIWRASLDVLNFLPIQAVDPFSGVIVTGYGTPPGGGRAYRAVVYVQDAALDARSLKLSMSTRNGPVSADTVRAVEDAILTRARQLRIADKDL